MFWIDILRNIITGFVTGFASARALQTKDWRWIVISIMALVLMVMGWFKW